MNIQCNMLIYKKLVLNDNKNFNKPPDGGCYFLNITSYNFVK